MQKALKKHVEDVQRHLHDGQPQRHGYDDYSDSRRRRSDQTNLFSGLVKCFNDCLMVLRRLWRVAGSVGRVCAAMIEGLCHSLGLELSAQH